MRLSWLVFCFLMSAAAGFAQLASDSITVTSTRSVATPVDTMTFQILIETPPDATLQQVTSALERGGLTGAQWAGYSGSGNGSYLWVFDVSTPFVAIKDTADKLTAISKIIGASLRWSIGFSGSTAQSPGPTACPIADLLADARAQAKELAAVGGVTAGPVLAMSDEGPPAVGGASYSFLADLFSPISGSTIPGALVAAPFPSQGLLQVFSSPSPQADTCSLTVKFALLRN